MYSFIAPCTFIILLLATASDLQTVPFQGDERSGGVFKTKSLATETKRLGVETKRLKFESFCFEFERKRLDAKCFCFGIERKTFNIECKRFGIERKTFDAESLTFKMLSLAGIERETPLPFGSDVYCYL